MRDGPVETVAPGVVVQRLRRLEDDGLPTVLAATRHELDVLGSIPGGGDVGEVTVAASGAYAPALVPFARELGCVEPGGQGIRRGQWTA